MWKLIKKIMFNDNICKYYDKKYANKSRICKHNKI